MANKVYKYDNVNIPIIVILPYSITRISEGGQAKIYRSESNVAIKQYFDKNHDDYAKIIETNFEINYLSKLKHNNIIKLHECFYYNQSVYLVFEFVKHSLHDFIHIKIG